MIRSSFHVPVQLGCLKMFKCSTYCNLKRLPRSSQVPTQRPQGGGFQLCGFIPCCNAVTAGSYTSPLLKKEKVRLSRRFESLIFWLPYIYIYDIISFGRLGEESHLKLCRCHRQQDRWICEIWSGGLQANRWGMTSSIHQLGWINATLTLTSGPRVMWILIVGEQKSFKDAIL